MSISQNGQTHSKNSSVVAHELFKCVWPFCGLALKGLSSVESLKHLARTKKGTIDKSQHFLKKKSSLKNSSCS